MGNGSHSIKSCLTDVSQGEVRSWWLLEVKDNKAW